MNVNGYELKDRQREVLDVLREPPESLWDNGLFVSVALGTAALAGYLLGRRRS